MSKNVITIVEKDGTKHIFDGWKANMLIGSIFLTLGSSVYFLGKNVYETGKKMIDSVKK